MAKFEIKFLGLYSEKSFIKVNVTDYNDSECNEDICIEIFDAENENSNSIIFLDKSTAIKFAKTLRTEINKITESEVNNEA